MIIIKSIKIEVNKGNLPYYKKIKNEINIGDEIEIDINNLPFGSNSIITAECFFCKKEKEISYKQYNRQTKNSTLKFTCSKRCAAIRTKELLMEKYNVSNIAQIPNIKEKIKKTNLEKYGDENFFASDIAKNKIKEILIDRYGVDNPLKSDEIKNKLKETNLEKYGSESSLGSPIIREKIKKTNIERYGFEQPSKSSIIKEKIISSNIEKWGGNSPMCNDDIKLKSKNTLLMNHNVDNPLKSDEIKKKIKETNLHIRGVEYPTQSHDVKNKVKLSFLEKYGVDHPFKSEEVKDSIKKTLIEKYGVDHPSKSGEIKKNIKNTCIEKYGVDNPSKSEEIRKKTIIGSDSNYIKYIGEGISLFKCDVGHEFGISSDSYHSRVRYNTPLCTICYPIGDSSSIKQIEVSDYIKSIYSGEVIDSYRDGLEIDIYIPELKIGFEFNGLYWHSEEYKDKNYHLNKTLYFKNKGIRIIHIWEDDWAYNTNIIKSQIKNWLRVTPNRIHARKCQIKLAESSVDFLNENHIQGSDKSIVKISLFFGDEMVSIMTFNKFEGRKILKDGEWNLSRFCTKLDSHISGGASRLLDYFIKTFAPSRIVSYADRSWSNGGLYEQMGFNLVSESNPDYKYIINGKRLHKQNFKRSKLKIDKSSITESQFMSDMGYSKIYDCGKLKFELLALN